MDAETPVPAVMNPWETIAVMPAAVTAAATARAAVVVNVTVPVAVKVTLTVRELPALKPAEPAVVTVAVTASTAGDDVPT
jgi:hypothetical protein